MALEFDTAVKRKIAEDEEPEERPFVPFVVNEVDPETDELLNQVHCKAYHPGDGQIIVLMAETAGLQANMTTQIAGMVNFFFDVLDAPSKNYLLSRLLDPEDPYSHDDIIPIVRALVEEWGGRPTRQPTDYLPSRRTGGQSSTRRTSKSTSSRSRSTASSTRSTAGSSAS